MRGRGHGLRALVGTASTCMQEKKITNSTPAYKEPVGFASGDRVKTPSGQEQWGGAGWARLGQFIGRLDAPVCAGTLVWEKDHFYIRDANDNLVDPPIIVLQRLMHANLADHIYKARAYGQIVINDLDDWYWGLDPRNDAFKSSHPKTNPNENTRHYKKVLGASDLVIVSTSYLRERIKPWVMCPIVVLKNTIDVGRFTPLEHVAGVPKIGWAGSTSHRSGDLEIMRGIIPPLVRSGEFTFQHSGHSEYSPPVHEVFKMAKEEVFTVPLVESMLYPSSLTMDIGIAPLRDTPFNHAKSDIKLLEYSASGIPWIGSPMTAYRELKEEWGIGRLAKNGQQWLKHIKELKDPEVRALEGTALREKAWTRDISLGAHALQQVLNDISIGC